MNQLNSEKGAALVVALVMLGLMAVIATTITMTSSIELKIARNEKVAKDAFYEAENGRVAAASAIQASAWGDSYSDGDSYEGNADIEISDGDFFMEGLNDSDTASSSPDLELSGALAADVDVDKRSTQPLPGGSAEFNAGYEGAGKEAAIQILFLIDSFGRSALGSNARIQTEYRVIPK